MKTYIGTKIIQAEPKESGSQHGYRVIYADGYESWSPKDVFEAAYVEMRDVTGLEPYQVRVVGEKAELDYKRAKLIAMVQSSYFEALTAAEKSRITRQLAHMDEYSAVLGERIIGFYC